MRYEEALEALDETDRAGLVQWHEKARASGDLVVRVNGEAAQPTGAFVSDSLMQEAALGGRFPELLRALARTLALGRKDFEKVTEQFERQGSPARLPTGSSTLARLVQAREIMQMASKAGIVSWPPQYPTLADWSDFRERLERLLASGVSSRRQVEAFFTAARLHPTKDTCFATTLEALDEDSPRGARDFGRLRDRLGLGWSTVDTIRGEGPLDTPPPVAVVLEYDVRDVTEVCVPTVADAGWWCAFRAAKPGASYGTTLNRRGMGAPGLPEVVHRNRNLECVRDRAFQDSGALDPLSTS